MVWPALIAGGAALVGGAMANRSNRKAAEAANDRQDIRNEENTALQREFAQSGIRWRVEDAKAAGLHPLYALGGTGATYQPQPIATHVADQSHLGRGLADAGQHLGRAIQAQQTPAQRQAETLQLQLLHAQVAKEHALASYYDSEAARSRQSSFQSSPIPSGSVEVGNLTGIPGQVKTKPDEIVSPDPTDPSKTSGIHAGWREYTFGKDRQGPIRLVLPVNEEGWSEGIGDLPIAMYPFVYRANMEKYGKQHALRVMRWIARGDDSGKFRGAGSSGSW